ncbi:hypothetical protein ACHAW6_005707 [Cyclotella cf. meneghiniana]
MTSVSPTPPHPSSTLVNISSDADLRLVRILAPHASPSFESTCSASITNGDAAGLLRAVLSEPDAIAALTGEEYSIEEACGAFSLFGALLDRVEDAEGQRRLCWELADAVAGRSGEGGKRSAMVAALFNLRSDGVEKVRLFARIVDLAEVEALVPGAGGSALYNVLEASTLQALVGVWGNDIPEVEKRGLFRAVVRGMDRVLDKLIGERMDGEGVASAEVEADKKIKEASDRKQIYLLLILDTYKHESEIDSEALTYAQQASVGAINDPVNLFSTQQRLLHLPAVKALQKSPSTAPLYDLLKIIHEGKLQDYRDFTAMPDKSGVFAAFQLNEAECTRNMSLLSLVSLAGEHEEIPYSAISSTLDIPEDQVEKWVILGVSSGLMEAKMDQLSKVVIVERCVVRQFGRNEWEALKIRLDKWKVNVRGVLDALKTSGAGTSDAQ